MMIKPVQVPAGEAVLMKALDLLAGSLTPAEIKKELKARQKARKDLNADIAKANKALAETTAAAVAEIQTERDAATIEAAALMDATKAGIAALKADFDQEIADARAIVRGEKDKNRTKAAQLTARENALKTRQETLEAGKDDIDRREAAANQKMKEALDIRTAAENQQKRVLAAAS